MTAKINDVIKNHFKKYFSHQHYETHNNEWSALRRAIKKLIKGEVEEGNLKIKEELYFSKQEIFSKDELLDKYEEANKRLSKLVDQLSKK